MSVHKIKVYNFFGLVGMTECRPIWQEIFLNSNSENPFLTWEWNYYWASVYADPEKIQILVAEHDGLPVGLVPLMVNKRSVTFLIDPLFADYGDFLLANNNSFALEILLNYCISLGKTVKFSPIRGMGSTPVLLDKSAAGLKRLTSVDQLSENPCVLPTMSFSSYMSERSKRVRQEIRTTINHLNRDGGWEFIESKSDSETEAILDSLFMYHHGRQTNKSGVSIFESSQNKFFFKRLPEKLGLGPARAHISAIKWRGRFVSSAYSLVCGQTFFYWVPSFDNSLKGVSLGKLHIKCLLEKCFSSGMTFDFMGGSEPYKYQWSNHCYKNIEFTIHKNRFESMVYLGVKWFKHFGKMTKNRLKFNNRMPLKIL